MIRTKFEKTYSDRKFRFLACTLSGILSSIPYFFPKLFFIEWISFIPHFCIFFDRDENKKNIFFYGFWNQFIKTAIVLSMFKELYSVEMFDFPPVIMVIAIVLSVIAISLIQSIPFGICALVIYFIFKNGKNKFLNILSVPTIYTFAELLKTIIQKTNLFGFLGFPWVMTYITQAEFTIGIQSASVFGACFITFIVILVNTVGAYAITNHKLKTPIIIICTILLANCTFGFLQISQYNHNDDVSVLIYQDNNSSYNKWSSSSVETCDKFTNDIEKYLEKAHVPDVIIMSETVFPVTFSENIELCGKNARYIENELLRLSKKYNTTIVCGAFSKDDLGKHNSLFMFENGYIHQTRYDKRSLVPFGEYIPHENILSKLPVLSQLNLSGSSLAPGHAPTLFECKSGVLGAMICYDSIFYYNALESAREGAQVLLLSTNDSWYNDSAAIMQHYSHSVFRAIETGRDIIRCATTGKSGIINSVGQTVSSSEIMQKQIVPGYCTLRNNNTIFSVIGYSYIYALLFIMTVYCIVIITRKKSRK